MHIDAQFTITTADGQTMHTELLAVTFDDVRREFGALAETFGAKNVIIEISAAPTLVEAMN